MSTLLSRFIFAVLLICFCWSASAQAKINVAETFLGLLSAGPQQERMQLLQTHWQPSYVPFALEILRFTRRESTADALLNLLVDKTGQDKGRSIDDWFRWQWQQDATAHPEYLGFKQNLYQNIDPKFAAYFEPKRHSLARIRLDEIRWGGVLQDGIPPLRNPKMVSAKSHGAKYLGDDNIVFGIAINGDVRAYPQRILAWHELFIDVVGGKKLAGVYCTLCGSVVIYDTQFKGQQFDLGTSGFLFRSNKLMYDKGTQSLWNSTWGKPVLGPLVDKGITLKQYPVVTTTWGAWRKKHPDSKVLSLDTGYVRDYGEGVAYQQYFATHKLMFSVPKEDNRLPNKAEVLALVSESGASPTAISSEYLIQQPIFHLTLGKEQLVVLTDRSGANRVYLSGSKRFKKHRAGRLIDDQSQAWTVTEDALIASDGAQLKRFPARRAFWFGWYAAHPETLLIH